MFYGILEGVCAEEVRHSQHLQGQNDGRRQVSYLELLAKVARNNKQKDFEQTNILYDYYLHYVLWCFSIN